MWCASQFIHSGQVKYLIIDSTLISSPAGEEFPMVITSEQTEQGLRQRRNFPETWMWLDTNIG